MRLNMMLVETKRAVLTQAEIARGRVSLTERERIRSRLDAHKRLKVGRSSTRHVIVDAHGTLVVALEELNIVQIDRW